MSKKGFYFDMERCIGCRTCQIACKDKNNLDIGIFFRKVSSFEVGFYPQPGYYHYSGTCNHCTNPKCVEGCPTGAMYIDADGTVQHNTDKCIGCRYCTWNCPYGVPQFVPEVGKVIKCDACKDLLDSGQNPVCVDACIMRALDWGSLDELKAKYKGIVLTEELPALPPADITVPSLLIRPRTIARQKDFRERVM